ncbi:MAG TPA: SDR family oxidoreductase [Pseudonocardia sp.]
MIDSPINHLTDRRRQHWLITGANAGIGRRLTQQLLERGDRVAATARSPRQLDDLKAAYPDSLHVYQLDVTDAARLRSVVEQAFTQLSRIDVVVSNAGYGLAGAAEELTDELIETQINTNLLGSIQLARAVLPRLRAQPGPRRGRIIQLSSVGGQMAYPGMSLYHTTKWGIEGFFEAVATEVAPFGIGVTLVEPGGVRTDFGGRSMALPPALEAYAGGPVGALRTNLAAGNISDTRPGDPDKVAAAIIASAEREPAPLRLTLGSDAYANIQTALRRRLDALDEQKDLAHSTDVDGEFAAALI